MVAGYLLFPAVLNPCIKAASNWCFLANSNSFSTWLHISSANRCSFNPFDSLQMAVIVFRVISWASVALRCPIKQANQPVRGPGFPKPCFSEAALKRIKCVPIGYFDGEVNIPGCALDCRTISVMQHQVSGRRPDYDIGYCELGYSLINRY
jgi:hypothetical protein